MGKTDKPFAFDDQLTNLARLGVIAVIPIFKGVLPTKVLDTFPAGGKISGPTVEQLDPKKYIITDFGRQFLEACSR